jgi:hypothetical protein
VSCARLHRDSVRSLQASGFGLRWPTANRTAFLAWAETRPGERAPATACQRSGRSELRDLETDLRRVAAEIRRVESLGRSAQSLLFPPEQSRDCDPAADSSDGGDRRSRRLRYPTPPRWHAGSVPACSSSTSSSMGASTR